TPPPVLPGLERSDDRMVGGVKVLRGVAVLLVIATADVSARQAKAQVHPGVAHFQTLLAPVSRGGHLTDLVHVLTSRRHMSPVSSRRSACSEAQRSGTFGRSADASPGCPATFLPSFNASRAVWI